MQIDPQARDVLDQIARAGVPDFPELDVAQARRVYRETCARFSRAGAAVGRIESLCAPGAAGDIPVRLYRPLGAADEDPLPALVYFHGGGWSLGGLDTHDAVCRELANLARCAVAAIDYRVAPEHKFPAAVDDAIAATMWLLRTGKEAGLDPRRLAVAGDAAGGNLAAVVALALAKEASRLLALQVLIGPATDLTTARGWQTCAEQSAGLTRAAAEWFIGNYLAHADDASDWRASPLRATDFAGVAPAYVLTGGFDPLCEEGRAYADRLAEAGVSVTYECFEGIMHGFIVMGGAIAAAQHALYRAAQQLRIAFKSSTPDLIR